MMTIDTSSFKVQEGADLNLSHINSSDTRGLSKEQSQVLLAELKKEMSELQDKLYAENKKSLLIIFQAMDAAGKDSAIKHIMSGLNPQGCQVYSFKQPTTEELDHDFLWRHYKALPERGRIGIHNRSHYENVMICKVHPKLAANQSKIPLEEIDGSFWKSRYKSIVNFEDHLSANGTVIIKFFLHISKAEQKKRFLARIDDPSKNWKFAESDIVEREQWDKYMHAYRDAFRETSTKRAPWYVIPADKKWFARVAICELIVHALKKMDLNYPVLPKEELGSLEQSKAALLAEKD